MECTPTLSNALEKSRVTSEVCVLQFDMRRVDCPMSIGLF